MIVFALLVSAFIIVSACAYQIGRTDEMLGRDFWDFTESRTQRNGDE